MSRRRAIRSFCAASAVVATSAFSLAADSQWVKVGASGRLVYGADDAGDRLMDYSAVGYKGGGVPLPNHTSVVTPDRVITLNVLPGGLDNRAQIQNAINTIAGQSINANGFRGVVQLNAGSWALSDTINITSSGIILRGVGSGANAASNTILAHTGTSLIDMVHVDSGNSRSTNTEHQIMDKVVPVGATSFTVDSTSGYAVGDSILVHRPSPQNWINDIQMNTLTNPWTPGSRDQNYERKITYIDQTRKRIFLEAPIVNAIEKKYTDTNGEAGTVSKYTFSRTTNVGVENIRGDGQAVLTTPDSEEHANSFVVFQDTADSWVRNVTGEHLVYATVEAGTNSRNITVDGAASVDPVSILTGGRRYPFNIEGSFVLMKNMTSVDGRHDFVNNSPSRGPNVFLDGVANSAHADSGTHQRWSTGTLWDNITTNHDLDNQNRYNSGTGHGWAGANMVIWNSNASDFYVQNPPTAQNWLIGSTGSVHSSSQFGPGVWPGYYDANNAGSKVTLAGETSLYRKQLAERLGHADEQKRQYWLGDFDTYENDGAADNAPVDATWLAAVNALKPGTSKVGFDTSLSASNISVPFTFNVDLGGAGGGTRPTRVTSATLQMAVHANNANAVNDSIWIESTGNAIPFSSLGTLPHFGNSDIVTLEFLASNPNLGLTFLDDGVLNVLVSDNHTVDWADLTFTLGSSKALTWTGATNGAWDINGTTNWTDGAIGEKFFQGDTVIFGDGPTNRSVALNTTVFPAAVTFNNNGANAYTVSGAGAIGGGASLVKSGTATLTLLTDNAYAGPTTINAGTVIVGANGTVGSLGAGIVTNNATLALNRSDAVNVPNNIGGAGTLRHIGSGTTTLSGSNTYGGQTVITNGTLKVTNSAALGTIVANNGTVTISGTGALDIGANLTANQLNFGAKPFVVSGDGPGATGAIVNNGSGVNQQNVFQRIILAGNASVGGDSRFDIRGGSPVLDLAGFTLTKKGTNQFSLVGVNVTSGSVNVTSGTFSIETSSTVAGTGTITYGPGTVGQFWRPTGTISRPMVVNGATLYDGGQTNTATIASNINLVSASTFNMSTTSGYTFTGVISEAGALAKNGNGKLILNGNNTYGGGTSVNAGTLEIAPSGTVGVGGLFVAGGGFVNVRAGRLNALPVAGLAITTPGVVDLNDNDMVIGSSTSTSSVAGYVALARSGGDWNGTGLTSTTARNNPGASTTLGILTGAEYATETGNTLFSGRSFGPDDTLVKYTWYGDTNFSGVVNFDDYVHIDVGFNTGLSGWLNGDFNYSGSVNFDDYVLIDIAFNTQSGTLGRAVQYLTGEDRSESGRTATGVGMVVEHFEQFGQSYAQYFLAAVPEPGAMGVAVGLTASSRRRREHRARSGSTF